MADMAEGVIVATWMLLAMLAPAGLLWATMRAYDLIADHRDRQRRRRVRRAMRQATYVDLIEWAQAGELEGGVGVAVRVEVDLQDVRTIQVNLRSVEMGPVIFHGTKDDVAWLRLEIAEAFDLLVPEEQAEKEAATAVTVAR